MIALWAPTRKKGRGGVWPFWNKVLQVQKGDVVIHLRGITPKAYFVGYSIASSNGFKTTRRPPDPGKWGFAEAFYRADLTGFTPFHQQINLTDVFASRNAELHAYLERHKKLEASKGNLFFVEQSARLQCLNGAYLSDIDEELLGALFGDGAEIVAPKSQKLVVSVETGSQISSVRTRLGQDRFASEIKRLYRNRCCFPGCTISDNRFLVGSHIARWSDNENLRGKMDNGICLCLVHDRAFEIGLFTLNQVYQVFVNPREEQSSSEIVKELLLHNGEQIRLSEVVPSDAALLEHWIRVDIEPESTKIN